MGTSLLVVLLSLSMSAAVVWFRLRFARHGLDIPGERSLHDRPTVHGGGLGILAVVLAMSLIFDLPIALIVGVFVLGILSAVDDCRHLPIALRLSVHLAVAASVVLAHMPGFGLIQLLLTLLIAWFVNAYNFMDGADGLAGSMAVVGFGAFALGFGLAEQTAFALFSASVAAAALGFLCFNWPPARIFMGDVGSIPLGFLVGTLGWSGVLSGAWPWWFPLMVFWLFFFDASLTLGRRALRREKVWRAHREHYYQRMIRMTGSHLVVVRAWIVMMIFGAGLALASITYFEEYGSFVFLVWAGLVAACAIWVDICWGARHDHDEKQLGG